MTRHQDVVGSINRAKRALAAGLRIAPAFALLAGAALAAPPAGATPVVGSCNGKPTATVINGGTVANRTGVDLGADGGRANAAADGEDGGGAAEANGGTIRTGDITTGGNRGNQIEVTNRGGATVVNGGTVRNDTRVNIGADGGGADARGRGAGGTAEAAATGGTIATGDIDTGGNAGNQISVDNCGGAAVVNGGTVVNDTRVGISADGGEADAGSGEDGGFFGGGSANAAANGGSIRTGDITTGNNRGNTIQVTNTGGASVVNGGTVVNDTRVALSADGGRANAEAGASGGTADADASGGTIETGDVSTGGNRGNTIEVNNAGGAAVVDGGNVVNRTDVGLSDGGGIAAAGIGGGDTAPIAGDAPAEIASAEASVVDGYMDAALDDDLAALVDG